MRDTERFCAQEPHRALLSIRSCEVQALVLFYLFVCVC